MQNQSSPGPQSTTAGGSGISGTGTAGQNRPGQSRSDNPQEELRRSAEQVADQVKEKAAGMKDEVVAAATDLRDQAAAMAEPLQQKARAVAEDQKRAGAERVKGVARAISSAADELDEEMPQTADWIRRGASQLEGLSQSVKDKSVEDLARDAERFARNNTAMFFGLSLVAGFALARFLKSGTPSGSASGSHGESDTSRGSDPYGTDPYRSADTYRPAGARTASPPLQPQPGSPAAPVRGPQAGPQPTVRTNPAAFPHNEF